MDEKGLIPIERAKDDYRQALEKDMEEKFQVALTSIITGKTPTKDFPHGQLPTRTRRGGKKEVEYIPVWWFIEQLNALFFHDWDHLVVNQGIDLVENQVWVLGRLVVRGLSGMQIIKEQFGSSEIKRYTQYTYSGAPNPRANQIMDLADDLKSATSDSLKKCATELGFGKDVYGNNELLERTTAPKGQIRVLHQRSETLKMSLEELDQLCQKTFEGKKPEELEQIDMLNFIHELDVMIKDKGAGAKTPGQA